MRVIGSRYRIQARKFISLIGMTPLREFVLASKLNLSIPYSKDLSFIRLTTLFALPMFLFSGWLVYLMWIAEITNILFILSVVIISSIYLIKKFSHFQIHYRDLRWVIAPALVVLLSWYVPWWSYTGFWSDSGSHVYMSLNFIGQWDWFLSDYNFRSPLVPGFLSFEIALTGEQYFVYWTSILLYISVLWQIQNLAERFSNKFRSFLCMFVFAILPTTRFWGQMVMTDVAVTGMLFFLVNVMIYSEDNPKNSYNSMPIGIIAGLVFLTKYTFIYLVGAILLRYLLKSDIKKAVQFLIGWLFITLPFLFHQLIEYGHPFKPLIHQTEFVVLSVTTQAGSYSWQVFLGELIHEVGIAIILLSIYAFVKMYMLRKSDFDIISLILFPLIVINAIILDWGEPRYNLPILAFILLFCSVDFIDYKRLSGAISLKYKSTHLFPYVCTFLMIITGASHLASLPDESYDSSEQITDFNRWIDFSMVPVNELDDTDILLAGWGRTIGVKGDIHSIWTGRYNGDPIYMSAEKYPSATHLLTTNVAPYFQWEKDFDWQLGHNSIEFEKIHFDGWWSSVLWKIDNTSHLSPDKYFSHHNGTVTGDLLILKPNETLTVGSENLSLKWIEVTSIRPYQQVMRVLGGEDTLMVAGCTDGGKGSTFASGVTMTSPPNNYIYVWIESSIL